MKYLKKFENESDYQEFKDGQDWVLPNICAISSINNVVFNKIPILISFTVAGNEYQAEKGMTWEEFVNSDYNTNNGNKFSLSGTDIYFKHEYGGNLTVYTDDKLTTTTHSYDEIINGHIYRAVSGGVGD